MHYNTLFRNNCGEQRVLKSKKIWPAQGGSSRIVSELNSEVNTVSP